MSDRAAQQHRLSHEWSSHPRWRGIERPYSAADVVKLRGTVHIEHSLALLGRTNSGSCCTRSLLLAVSDA